MMKLYRAVKVIAGRPLPDLSGISAKYEDGTWHKKFYIRDTRIIYTCEQAATCLLEIMANMGSSIALPEELHILEITGLEESDVVNIGSLPENWHKNPLLTQKTGMDWLNSNKSLALRVPSKSLMRVTTFYLILCIRILTKFSFTNQCFIKQMIVFTLYPKVLQKYPYGRLTNAG